MSFIDYFGEISDPRKDINVKHNLLDVIFFTITGIVSETMGSWSNYVLLSYAIHLQTCPYGKLV